MINRSDNANIRRVGSASILLAVHGIMPWTHRSLGHSSSSDGASAVRQYAGQCGQNAGAPRSFEFVIHFRERINREFQVFARMRGRNLRADACGAVRNDRIEKADHVNAFLQHARSELL
jgi:hypothetical protein